MISRKKPFIPDEAFPASLKTVVIDHHASNTKYARDYNLVDQTYPATCQILFDLFTEWGIDITPDIAADLFIGMFTDTGGFRYPMTTSETYAIATVLTKKYPAFPKLISDMENTRTKESIIFQGIAYSHIEEFCGGKVAIASVSNEDVVKHAFKNEDMSSHSISSLLKSVIGYDVGICLIEIEPHVVKASMRTRDENKYNLSAIATSLGGGGHKAAAGVLFTCSLDEAKKRIADAIITYVTMHV
jgi:phosphoesterase RecJ-like protein